MKKNSKLRVNKKISKKSFKNKLFDNKFILIGLICFLFLLLILLTSTLFKNVTGNVVTEYSTLSFNNAKGLSLVPEDNSLTEIPNPATSSEIIRAKWSYEGKSDSLFGILLGVIFGNPIIITTAGASTNIYSGMVVVIAVWLLLFVTFSDIISTFSTFNKGVSWITGFLIAIIAAQMNLLIGAVKWSAGAFAVLGSFAVFVGLGAAFLAFIAVNLGLSGLAKFVAKRRMMKTIAYGEVGKGMMNEGAKTLIQLATTTAQEGKKVQVKGI